MRHRPTKYPKKRLLGKVIVSVDVAVGSRTEVRRTRRRFGLAPKSGPTADIAARQLRAISLPRSLLLQADAVHLFMIAWPLRRAGTDIKERFARLSVRRGWRLTVIVRAAHAWGGVLNQHGLDPIKDPIDTLGHLSDRLPGLLVIPLD
jgi:hypothetical protein